MGNKDKVILRIQACGCIIQKIPGRTGVNHIYCGSPDCPFDEVGDYNKYSKRNEKAKVKVAK